jgi:hypothetical protein
MPYIERRMYVEYGPRPGPHIIYASGSEMEMDGPALSAVIEFFQNPYWTRMWIVQELVVSRDFVVYGAHHILSGWALRCFAIWLDDHVPADATLLLMSPHVLYLLSRAPNGGTKYLLSDLLHHLDKGQCSDPKDRVYFFMIAFEEWYFDSSRLQQARYRCTAGCCTAGRERDDCSF